MAAVIASLLKKKGGKGKKPKKNAVGDAPDLVPHVCYVSIAPFPQFPPKWVVYNGSTKDGADSSMDLSRKSPTSLKKSGSKSDFVQKTTKLLSQSFDSEGADGVFESAQSYSGVYIGLILLGMGSVITFVGLGDKGFKTLELKLIGPVLCLVGVSCVVFKILQCIFPRLFQWPNFRRRPKLTDTENRAIDVSGVGVQNNGHVSAKLENAEVFSPRVTLTGQSSNKTPRPQSTVPNFIEDSTDDEDEYDGRRGRRGYLTRDNSVMQSSYEAQAQQQLQLKHKLEKIQQERLAADQAETANQIEGSEKSEILLDPKTLNV